MCPPSSPLASTPKAIRRRRTRKQSGHRHLTRQQELAVLLASSEALKGASRPCSEGPDRQRTSPSLPRTAIARVSSSSPQRAASNSSHPKAQARRRRASKFPTTTQLANFGDGARKRVLCTTLPSNYEHPKLPDQANAPLHASPHLEARPPLTLVPCAFVVTVSISVRVLNRRTEFRGHNTYISLPASIFRGAGPGGRRFSCRPSLASSPSSPSSPSRGSSGDTILNSN